MDETLQAEAVAQPESLMAVLDELLARSVELMDGHSSEPALPEAWQRRPVPLEA